jgi:nicotinate-nucleotide adenylyltransferase
MKPNAKAETSRFHFSRDMHRRIGIFGGTFDPIHLGHLRSVEEASDIIHLDLVLLIPAARPPHKLRSGLTPFRDRLNMTRLAVEDNKLIEVLDIEARRSGPSFSVDTLENLRSETGPDTDFFFLIGMDAFLEIESWHRYQRLFELACPAVFSRNQNREEEFRILTERLKVNVTAPENAHEYRNSRLVTRVRTTLIDISGTEIRSLVKDGKSIRYLVPEPIGHYILQRRLYLNERGA